jgi:hypothetical protein
MAEGSRAALKESDRVKLVVFVPLSDLGVVREAIARAGGGIIGNYRDCSFSVRGEARFTPGASASPAVGRPSETTECEEARVEVVCSAGDVGTVVEAMLAVHPYEEPGWEIYRLWELLPPSKGRSKARL